MPEILEGPRRVKLPHHDVVGLGLAPKQAEYDAILWDHLVPSDGVHTFEELMASAILREEDGLYTARSFKEKFLDSKWRLVTIVYVKEQANG